jgi:hypothetical protein
MARGLGFDHVGSLTASVLALAALALCACGSGSDADRNLRQKPLDEPSHAQVDPLDPGVPSTAAADQGCPAEAPLDCTEGCCPAGASCAADGGCEAEPAASGCPAEAPLACQGSAGCTGGCTAFDESSSGNHLTVSGTGFGEGRFGSGLAAGASATGPTKGFTVGDAPVTFELWIRWQDDTSVKCYCDAGPQQVFSYGFISGYPLGLHIYVDVSWDTRRTHIQWPYYSSDYSFAGDLGDGQWHFVALTYGNGTSATYLDGALVYSHAFSFAGATPYPLTVGNATGELDELRVLDYAATGEQIAADFAAGPFAADASTVGLWHFEEGASERCCPAEATCGATGACEEAPSSTPSCPAATPVSCGGGLCCPTGTTCATGGCAAAPAASGCPSGYPVQCPPIGPFGAGCCLSGYACPTSTSPYCTNPSGTPTQHLPQGASCPAGQTLCDTSCCGAGTTCNAGSCIQSAQVPIYCANSVRCGASCCPANTTCGPGNVCVRAAVVQKCPPSFPIACGAGGSCCGANAACISRTIGTFQVVCQYLRQPHHGAGGPSCGSGKGCATGSVCGAPGLCCPASKPHVCDSVCCPAGVSCDGSKCGCAAGAVACDSLCCGAGSTCSGGRCDGACPDLAYPVPCGNACCAKEIECQDGACACPGDHPVECSTPVTEGATAEYGSCCLPGATCEESTASCGCPPGRESCADLCCEAGEVCSGGECVGSSSSGGDGTCTTNGECQGFGDRHCEGGAYARCGTDSLCHCCDTLCSGTCACLPCVNGAPCTAGTQCAPDGTCVHQQGGKTSD